METAKVINERNSQAVYLPESCHLTVSEVLVSKLGDAVLLVPKEKAWETFINGLNHVPDDFFPNGREPEVPAVRDAS